MLMKTQLSTESRYRSHVTPFLLVSEPASEMFFLRHLHKCLIRHNINTLHRAITSHRNLSTESDSPNKVPPSSPSAPSSSDLLSYLPTLTLYTKEECSLCDEAKEVLQPHWHMFKFEEVDIEEDGNEKWHDMYCYDIPVFHFNGKFLMKHKVNTRLLLRKIKEFNNNMDQKH